MKRKFFFSIITVVLLSLCFCFTAFATEADSCSHPDENIDFYCDLCSKDLLVSSGNYGYSYSPFVPSNQIEYKLHFNGTLYFFGSGKMHSPDINNTYSSPLPIHSSNVKKVIIEDGITSIGAMAFKKGFYSYIEEVILPDSITEIEEHAFYGCNNLKKINIPNSVTKIGSYAFYDCYSLESINIPKSVKTIELSTFKGCKKLTNIIIPPSVTEIEGDAFSNCVSLKQLIIPESVDKITSTAFSYCNFDKVTINGDFEGSLSKCSVSELVISGTIGEINKSYVVATYWDGSAFGESGLTKVTITDGATSIGKDVFANSNYLQEVILPDSLKTLGVGAFGGCTALENISFGNNIEEIGIGSFGLCTSLEEVIIPSSVKTIGAYAFEGCSNLKNVIFNEGIESIGREAFFLCDINELVLPTTLKNIDMHAFTYNYNLKNISISENSEYFAAENCMIFNKEKTILYAFCNYYSDVITMPASLKQTSSGIYITPSVNMLVEHPYPIGLIHSFELKEVIFTAPVDIGSFTFAGCINLESIVLPEGTEKIGDSAFFCCLNLKKIDLPDSLSNLGSGAFYVCTSLENISIPDNVTTIISTFTNCKSLKEIDLGNGVKEIGMSTFIGCNSLESITLPASLECIESWAFNYDYEDSYQIIKIKFLNPDTIIGCYFEYDEATESFYPVPDSTPYSLPLSCIIYGYPGSTAEEYANLYNRQFVAIECEDEHNFGEWSESLAPTCTEKGVEERICDTCKKAETREISPLGHSFGEWYTDSEPTCIADGTERRDCFCGETETRSIPLIPDNHIDEDENNFCDNCGISLSNDDDVKEECSHLCHHTNAFTKFIWKIVQFFWKLFNINPTCSCGEAHY